MQHSIIQGYIEVLSNINDSNKDTAILIAEELSRVKTSEEAESILAKYQRGIFISWLTFFGCTKDSLSSLKEWHQQIKAVNELKKTDITAIIANGGAIPPQVKPFVDLLFTTLSDPKSCFHFQYCSLIKMITNNTDNIPVIFEFLSGLTLKELPNPPTRGSFADIMFTDPDSNHIKTAQLLYSLPKIDGQDNTWDIANGLLQALLNISKDIHTSTAPHYVPVHVSPAIESGLR